MGTSIPPQARELLRALPAIDSLTRRPAVEGLPRPAVLRAARQVLATLRDRLLKLGTDDSRSPAESFGNGNGSSALAVNFTVAASNPGSSPGWDLDAVAAEVARLATRDVLPRHRRVLNGTGIVLHTGIGRAPLGDAARDALQRAAGYAVVEVDPLSGERNQREERVSELLCDLLDVGGALVVNNNAAAVNLCLRALSEGRESIVSRGELVEIGGGFRMPDVMAEAGCRMVEVGATNRTHLRDYEGAIGEETALLVKVHPSNYRMVGFAGTPDLTELAALGRKRGVTVFEDLGSGLLVDEPPEALRDEPLVRDSVATGAEVICFSGDKLLGGPQCGILVGDREQIATCRRHPLYRAFRCDKLILAALEATLQVYRDGDPLQELPTLRAIARPASELRVLAENLAAQLATQHATQFRGTAARVVASESFVGSGANPARPIPSFAVALPGRKRLADVLRADAEIPMFARIVEDEVLLDLRTLADESVEEVVAVVGRALDKCSPPNS